MQVRGMPFRSNPQQIVNIHRRRFPWERFAPKPLSMITRIVTFPKMT
jgi:hypothetical protein